MATRKNKSKKEETPERIVSVILPKYVTDIGRILQKEGYEAYLVGGSVRDIVMGIEPHDYDIATDAKPEALLKTFPSAVATGIKFGTVLVLSRDEHGERHGVEITTYRSEENYIDGRWPSKVEFVEEINQDLGRRDFTINALALDLESVDYSKIDPTKESKWQLVDLFGGLEDLDSKIIRAVGSPEERFSEDGLRAYRACRLASQLDFEIEKGTFDAISKSLGVTKRISAERIRDEFVKLLLQSPKPSKGIELFRLSGLLEQFMPELLEGVGVEQPKFHADDVYVHTLRTVDAAADDVKLAALFHDIAKPRKATQDGHFYGHDSEGAKMAKEIMTRLKFSKAEIKRTSLLVQNHMFYYPYFEGSPIQDKEAADKLARQKDSDPSSTFPSGYWTDAAIRRFVRRVGEENVDALFKLRIADAAGNPKSSWDPREIEALEIRISEVRAQDMALKIEDLDIDGHDLQNLGIKPGPEMGRVLDMLLEKVLDDPGVNSKEKLLGLAQKEIRE